MRRQRPLLRPREGDLPHDEADLRRQPPTCRANSTRRCSATGQLGIPATAKVQRSYTPVITGPAGPLRRKRWRRRTDQTGLRHQERHGLEARAAVRERQEERPSAQRQRRRRPVSELPGNGIAAFPWLLVEESGHQGKYIYAEVSQDELFDPKFQKWIAIGHGSAKDSGSGWWSKTEITYSVSFTRLKK